MGEAMSAMDLIDKLFHYCQGTWIEGFVLDCQVEDHNVKLQQKYSPPYHGTIGDRQSRLAGKGS